MKTVYKFKIQTIEDERFWDMVLFNDQVLYITNGLSAIPTFRYISPELN